MPTITSNKDIRVAIAAVLEGLETPFETHPTDKSTFGGFPALIVAKSENESDYGSSQKDRLVFIFKVRALYLIKEESELEAADTAMDEVMDELLTVFSDRSVLGATCDWVEPAPGVSNFEIRGDAVYRSEEITLRCVKYL